MGTDESSFNRVLCAQSMAQLQLVFEEYHRATGKTIEQAVKSEMSGDLENGFLAIVACMKDRPVYFAQRLYYSMKVCWCCCLSLGGEFKDNLILNSCLGADTVRIFIFVSTKFHFNETISLAGLVSFVCC